MRLIFYVIFAFLVLLDTSCTHEISIQQAGPTKEAGQVSGTINLPSGTKVDTTGLKVYTALESVTPVNSSYAVDTAGKTSTTLLMNKDGDVLLMGYNYPGQKASDLSPESTALSILMNSLIMNSLTTEGKLDAIKKIKAQPAFGRFVSEVSTSLQAGKSPIDTSNVALFRAMSEVFKGAAGLKVGAVQSYAKPISIKTANTELLMQNSYVSASYVAGIYKDGKNLARFTIDGRRIFATSVTDAVAGKWGDGYGIPDPVIYSMAEDGEYNVVIRSGKPLADDGTVESKLARRENVYFFILNLVLDYLPIPAGCVKSTAQGVVDLSKSLIDKKEAVLSNAKSPAVFSAAALELAAEVFELSNELTENCTQLTDDSHKFAKAIGKLFRYVSIASNFMVYGNVISHTNDLFQANPAMDTCFLVVGLKTFKCGEQPTYFVEPVSGDNQKGDANKELAAPLKIRATYEDGKPAAKAMVNWVIKSGGGKINSNTSVTNNEGIAEIKWTLGASAGEQSVEAFVNKKVASRSTIFRATASTGAASKIEILLNSDGGYSNPLQVRVTDANGKPVPSIELEWRKFSRMELRSFDRFTNDEGIAEGFVVFDEMSVGSMEVVVKNDESKSVTFAPQELVGGATTFHNYIQPGVDRNALPNPVKIFITDRYLVPQPASNALRIRVDLSADRQKYMEGPDQFGILNILRPDPSLTTYRITVTQNGKAVGVWANVVIK